MIYRDAFRVRPLLKPPEIRESEWDERFYVGKLQDYRVEKTQKSQKGAVTDRSCARLRPILSPVTSSTTSRRASKLPLSPRSTTRAYVLWGRRRTLTRNATSAVSSPIPARQDSAQLLSTRETVMRAVGEREKLLERLSHLADFHGNEQQIRGNVIETLREIQRISVEVATKIEELRRESGGKDDFEWQGGPYLSKMKADLETLQNSPVGKYMPDVSDDPMLIRALPDTFTRLRSDSNPTPSAAQLIQAESTILHAYMSIQLPSPAPHEDSISLPSHLTYYRASRSSIDLLASSLLSTLIVDFVTPICPVICSEACQEWERAHLTLYSSRILDQVVSQILSTEIPACAYAAYIEEVDREFFALQRDVIETVVLRELRMSVEMWALEVAAEEIAKDLGNTVEIAGLVREAIREEQEDCKSLMESIFCQILSDYLSEEWLEILCEDEFSGALIESRLKDLPTRTLSPVQLQSKVINSLYQDILHSYVSGLWLDLLVRSVLTDSPLPDPMPLSPVRKRTFKAKK